MDTTVQEEFSDPSHEYAVSMLTTPPCTTPTPSVHTLDLHGDTNTLVVKVSCTPRAESSAVLNASPVERKVIEGLSSKYEKAMSDGTIETIHSLNENNNDDDEDEENRTIEETPVVVKDLLKRIGSSSWHVSGNLSEVSISRPPTVNPSSTSLTSTLNVKRIVLPVIDSSNAVVSASGHIAVDPSPLEAFLSFAAASTTSSGGGDSQSLSSKGTTARTTDLKAQSRNGKTQPSIRYSRPPPPSLRLESQPEPPNLILSSKMISPTKSNPFRKLKST